MDNFLFLKQNPTVACSRQTAQKQQKEKPHNTHLLHVFF